MKLQVPKRLWTSILPVTIGIFSLSTAHSQIIYTDVNPDQVFTCYNLVGYTVNYDLDLNNDSIADFQIYADEPPFGCLEVRLVSLNSNPLNTENTKLSLNQVIDSNLAWESKADKTLEAYKWEKDFQQRCTKLIGDWSTSSDGYLGLKFNIGSQFFYGWAQLSVTLPGLDSSYGKFASFTIRDYAYNSTPNQSIRAGDTGEIATNIHNIKGFSSIAISPNAFQHVTRISFSLPQTEKVSVQIFDVQGRLIRNLANQVISQGNNQLQWNATDENGNAVSTGIYLLKIDSQDFCTDGKVDGGEMKRSQESEDRSKKILATDY